MVEPLKSQEGYWRDKQGHEVDLIWLPRGKNPVAIECKLSVRDFDPANLLVFARLYPKATLLVTSPRRNFYRMRRKMVWTILRRQRK